MTGATGNVLDNDTDPNNDPLNVTGFTIAGIATPFIAGDTATLPGVGSLQINADGSFTFTPLATYHGAVPVATYSISDGQGGTDTATLSFTDVPNQAPDAVNDGPIATTAVTGATGNVLANDTDPNNDPLTVSGFTIAGVTGNFAAGATATIPGVGTLQINADGSFTFTPLATYHGPVPTATYSISDGQGGTATADLSFTDVPNQAPVANVDGPVATTAVTGATGNVLGNDTDPNNDPLTVTGFTIAGVTGNFAAADTATIPGVGSLQIKADGSFTFTPLATYHGAVPVATYSISDGQGGTDTATLSFTDVPNQAPDAVNDGPIATTAVTGATGNVLGNDTDPNNDPLNVTGFTITGIATPFNAGDSATIPGVGSLQINADGSFTFTPLATYQGPVPTATYSISDGQGGTTTADLSFVDVPNQPPVAVDDNLSVNEDTTTPPLNLVANDTDPNRDSLSVQSINGTALTPGVAQTIAVTNGTVNIDAAGGMTFTPAADYNGPVSFDYVVADGKGGTDTGTVNITVVAVNDNPIDGDEINTVTEDTTLSVAAADGLLKNSTDIDGGVPSISQFEVGGSLFPVSATAPGVATLTGVGTLTINSDGSYSFAPAPNYNGPVPVITYTVSDNAGGSDTSILTLDVTSVNDAPTVFVPIADQIHLDKDSISLPVNSNFADVENDTLTFSVTGLPIGLSIDPNTGLISGTLTSDASQAAPMAMESIPLLYCRGWQWRYRDRHFHFHCQQSTAGAGCSDTRSKSVRR